jgi:hypothetical protein
MVMKRLIVLAVLGFFVVGAVLAVRWLPWWALVLGFLLLVVLGVFVIGRLVRRLILMPFRAKGAVLKGASARVHLVSPAAASATEGTAGASAESREHYLVEVTIMPGQPKGPFGLWEPGELRLVRSESVLRPESDEPDDEDSACEITKIQIEGEGRWLDDEGVKYGGTQRLRLHVAARPGVRDLKFRYYFEEFGSVRLP